MQASVNAAIIVIHVIKRNNKLIICFTNTNINKIIKLSPNKFIYYKILNNCIFIYLYNIS